MDLTPRSFFSSFQSSFHASQSSSSSSSSSLTGGSGPSSQSSFHSLFHSSSAGSRGFSTIPTLSGVFSINSSSSSFSSPPLVARSLILSICWSTSVSTQ
ncbi:hypothetical protein OGAPHI_000774 [Ogataea philodendri]|uniref:Uncharacterized protein n=1 Tax=Ogataea philodendri TaxID=1378263 RepID=A0A9P8PF11_9ASCO|nr:uncharacterized protein OGAPHI_000774 [Ogataea philodendri]KAH3671063.1 hypothetical protein OGAPHI_000774 [Ogataea philodendri]